MEKTQVVILPDQLKIVLKDLEQLEAAAIDVMKLIREPKFSPDLFGQFADIVLRIQVRIREFRSELSKSSPDFDQLIFQEFVEYATPALRHCYEIAYDQVKND